MIKEFYILQDDKGNIWACTSSGKAYQYNPLLDDFELKADFAQLSNKYFFINHVHIDTQGTFWISESLAFYRYNPADGIETVLDGFQANSSLEYKGNIYIATIKGVYKYDTSTKEKQLLFYFHQGKATSLFRVSCPDPLFRPRIPVTLAFKGIALDRHVRCRHVRI